MIIFISLRVSSNSKSFYRGTTLDDRHLSFTTKNQKKDTAEIHLMFTANEEIKEGKFMTHKLWLKTVFELIIFFHILRVSQSD